MVIRMSAHSLSQSFQAIMMWWTCLLILCVATTKVSSQKDSLEVTIAQGTIRGHRDNTGEVFEFYNVPYATAPTGEDKFKGPLPPPTWTETYDAIDEHIICPQVVLKEFMPDYLKTQENCLIANIYVPDTEEKNLSVLVIVHGGAFQIGYGDWLKSKNLMKNKDLIVVNFNYRLGVHGFLCLGTEAAPGNAGMKDQVALLRWVQQNIAAFGGNPNDVTIAGCSAGSASVDLLMISKLAQGLFHKVIPESGACLAAFSMQPDPLKKAKEHAISLNFTKADDIYALEKFYKTLPYDILVVDAMMARADSTFMFTPCIERAIGGEAFLTESPRSILTRGDYKKVPMLYGFANMEGQLRIELFDLMLKDMMNEKFSDFLPGDLKFPTEEEKEEVTKLAKEFYFDSKPVSAENILKYIEYFSDTYFVYSTIWSIKLHIAAGHDQLYFYEYAFVDDDTPVIPHTNVRGANHCAQTMAVNDGRNLTHQSEHDITQEYKNMKKVMRELWHNFIKTGKPVPEGSSLPAWPPVGADLTPYMSLGQELELRGLLSPDNVQFWEKIYQKYYREPIPPPEVPSRPHIEL